MYSLIVEIIIYSSPSLAIFFIGAAYSTQQIGHKKNRYINWRANSPHFTTTPQVSGIQVMPTTPANQLEVAIKSYEAKDPLDPTATLEFLLAVDKMNDPFAVKYHNETIGKVDVDGRGRKPHLFKLTPAGNGRASSLVRAKNASVA